MVLGIVFYLLLYIILPILNFLFSFNFHNGIKNLYVIAIFIFIGALIGYSDMYDKVRDKRIGKYRKWKFNYLDINEKNELPFLILLIINLNLEGKHKYLEGCKQECSI